jgi:hypothetical protein
VVRLAASFVPAADEVGRLQRGQDDECQRFQVLAEQGHYAGRTQPSNTRQGIYAAAPSGKLLASINTRDPAAMAAMLRRALEAWEALPREERLGPELPAVAPPRWESRYPANGLVLRSVVRDVEREELPDDWRAEAWNQDFAWFTAEEALALLPEPKVGAERVWPAELARRLARCHLVDSVRGQTPAFQRHEVELAEIRSRVVRVTPERMELELLGSARTVARGRWPVGNFADQDTPLEQERGFACELLGRASYEFPFRGRFRPFGRGFESFELVAVGTRLGGTQFNARGDDLAPAPMGVSFTLAGASPAERVAPALIWDYGWPPP